MSHVARCMLPVTCCIFHTARYTVHVACCTLHVARCILQHASCFMLHAARCILAAGDFGCPIPSIVRRRNYAHTGAGESAGAFAARRSAASTAFYTNTSAFPNIQGRVHSRHGSAVHFRVCAAAAAAAHARTRGPVATFSSLDRRTEGSAVAQMWAANMRLGLYRPSPFVSVRHCVQLPHQQRSQPMQPPRLSKHRREWRTRWRNEQHDPA